MSLPRLISFLRSMTSNSLASFFAILSFADQDRLQPAFSFAVLCIIMFFVFVKYYARGFETMQL